MLESVAVGLIVSAAALYAVWALLPATARRNVAARWARKLGGPAAPGLAGRIAARLLKTAAAPAGGCSECPSATLTPAERAQKQDPQDRARAR